MKQRSPKIALYGFLLIVLVTLTFVTSSVIAYIVKDSGEVKNEFTPAVSKDPTVEEDFNDGKEKKNVKINVGETGYPVYVRAAIIITWQDKDGIVYFSEPEEDDDYTIALNKTDWKYEGGYYYYVAGDKLQEVQSNGTTEVLIKSCEQKKVAPADGYTLSVEIIAQTVQSIGTTDGNGNDSATEIPAYKDAWKLSW